MENIVIKLKQNCLKAIKYKESNDGFSEIKHFCGDDCTITYEITSIDDIWLCKVYDSLREKKITVLPGDYVVNLPDDNGFAVISSDYKDFFEEIGEGDDNDNGNGDDNENYDGYTEVKPFKTIQLEKLKTNTYKKSKQEESNKANCCYDDDDPYRSHTFDHWLRDLDDFKRSSQK